MSAKLGRRAFFASAAVSGLSLYVGGWWFFKVRSRDSTDMIAAILRKKLSYLRLSDAGVTAFAREAQARLEGGVNHYLSWLGILRPLYWGLEVSESLPQGERIRRLEDRVVRQFLLSSDFFLNGADEAREVEYVSYYDPYGGTCTNPFANLEM